MFYKIPIDQLQECVLLNIKHMLTIEKYQLSSGICQVLKLTIFLGSTKNERIWPAIQK